MRKKRLPTPQEVESAEYLLSRMVDPRSAYAYDFSIEIVGCFTPQKIIVTGSEKGKLLPFHLYQKQIGILDRGCPNWFDRYQRVNEDLGCVVFERPIYSKMYILTRNRFPIGHQANCAAHAAVKCVETFRQYPDMIDWLDSSFRKVTCWVSDDQFEKARHFADRVTMREDALGDKVIAMAFVPRQEWPDIFRTFPLFGKGSFRVLVRNLFRS